MAWRRLASSLSSVRGDTVVAVTIPIGCAALLLEAYCRTELGDAEQPTDCAFAPSQSLITADHVRELEQTGIVVLPNAVPADRIVATRREIHQLQGSFFEQSTNESDVRQDKLQWVAEADNDGHMKVGKNLSFCIRLIRGIVHALEHEAYQGSHSHVVPRQCQLAFYRGDEKASYQRHLDRCNSPLTELGLLEWMRLSDYRGRSLTTILYLNEPDRPRVHGGALRCWLAGDDGAHEPSFDVQPQGGTLVIFQSDKIEHMVLPSSEDRYALTNWVHGVLREG